jgi:hypothetical protein
MTDLYFKLPEKTGYFKKNAKILILIEKEDGKEEYLTLLKNIIKALKMDFEKECELYILSENENIGSLCSQYANIIFFGIDLNHYEVNGIYKMHKIYEFGLGKYLLTHKLKDLTLDQQKKSQLWKVLQNMFQIS